MKLERADGASFAMSVAGYEFPELGPDDDSANWLLIRIDVNHPLGSWSATDPSLQTDELAALADWLDAIGSDSGLNPHQYFTEPCLEFHINSGTDGPALLVVNFAHEYRPPWAKRKFGEEHVLEFPLSELNLKEAAVSIRDELTRFPQRAEE